MLDITYEQTFCPICFHTTAILKPCDITEHVCQGCGNRPLLPHPLTRHDEHWTTGTHITFRNHGTMNGSTGPQRKTDVIEVLEKGGGAFARLGDIRWFGRWRKYCFFPVGGTLYEETCLREIALFCQQETRLYNKKAREKRKAAKA